MAHRLLRRGIAVGVVVVLVGGSGTAYALSRGTPAPDYRTATATRGTVQATLALTGTVDAAHRADLGFATSGTVARVTVHQGERVKAGQVLASLDTTALDAAVDRASAAYQQAKARLASDEDAQASIVAAATSSSSSTSTTSRSTTASTTTQGATQRGKAPRPTTTTSTTGVDLSGLQAQQKAVEQAQAAATQALQAARDALAAQTTTCAHAYQPASTPTASPSPTASPTPTASPSPTATPTTSATDQACTDALALVQDKQQASQQAEDDLARALDALAQTLTRAVQQLQHAAQQLTHQQAQQAHQHAQQQTTKQQSSTPTRTVTAAQLASDEASIAQARADLVVAQQDRAQATLRSTRSGRVVAIDTAAGDAVSAGSTEVTIVGGRAITVTATVPESRIGEVHIGQAVRVSPPGSAVSTTGRVQAIGLAADSSTGTASYPVTVGVEDPTIALPTGSDALLDVVTATAKNAITVPVSAVTRTGDSAGGRATVRVWDGTTLTPTPVILGALGSTEAQVLSGLKAGDRVVLADRSEAISGASNSINDRGGFGGRFGGIRGQLTGGDRGPQVQFSRGG